MRREGLFIKSSKNRQGKRRRNSVLLASAAAAAVKATESAARFLSEGYQTFFFQPKRSQGWFV